MVCAYKSLSFRYKDFRMKKQDRMDVIMHLNDKFSLRNDIILNFYISLCFYKFLSVIAIYKEILSFFQTPFVENVLHDFMSYQK